jgi:AcrR family transcriptional regulator
MLAKRKRAIGGPPAVSVFGIVRLYWIETESIELTETAGTPARGYDSPLRREQARQTQRRVVDAAYRLFLERGYAATTMNAVAAEAGVSAQTVYKAFGTKAALVKRVVDVTLVGDDEPVPLAEREDVSAAYDELDPRRFLAWYADLGRTLMERLAPLLAVVMGGARAGEAELVELVATMNGERLQGTLMAARRLDELGALRPDLSVEAARDLIWTLNSFEVWDLLVVHRGWTPKAYSAWVGRAMADAVVRDGA